MSPAVTFVTLFLSLTLGPRPVTVAVAGGVAQVEIRLDGESLGVLDGEPWTLTSDFGLELEPHQLVAIGRDREGREVARTRQLVNLPGRRAEARLALQGTGGDGRPKSARLAWESREGLQPVAIRVAFDGRPVAFDDPRDIPLPPYDPRTVHSLTAELTFTGDLEARVVASFGGGMGERVDSGLTAVPIVAANPRAKTPTAERMAGWLRTGDRALEVFAAEQGPAEILIVVDRRAQQRLWDLGHQRRQGTTSGGQRRLGPRQSPGSWRGRLRFVAATPENVRTSGQPLSLFPVSEDLSGGKAKPKGIAENLFHRAIPEQPGSQRLADAVATAGLVAAEDNRPRAVVLIVDDHPRDLSQLRPETVRRYLQKLRVPFRVWSTSGSAAGKSWGDAAPITDQRQLTAAVGELTEALGRQHVVWVVGSHLPQEIEIHRQGWKIAG